MPSNLFGPGNGRGRSADDRRQDQDRAQIADGRARGTNYVRVRDVAQRHSTGTGRNGTVIRGTAH